MVVIMLNDLIIKTLPLIPKPLVHIFAKKYIAGDTLGDAIRVTKDFAMMGGMTTIDVLGEFVTSKERALTEREMSREVIESVHKHNLPTYLSIKPTSLGLGIDFDFCVDNVAYLADIAKQYGVFIRIDMENSPYTDNTLRLYKTMRDKGYEKIGFVIQSYMRRSLDWIKNLIDYKPNIRLCKGIYVEPEEIAYKDKEEVRNNFKVILDFMLDNDLYSGIATHDEPLLEYAEETVKSRNLDKSKYEFQMLLGVKENRRDELLGKGHNVRIYVPFGEDWYGYSTRRLKENPEVAGHIFKSVFGMS